MDYVDRKFPALAVLLGGLIPGIWGVLHLSFTESVIMEYSSLSEELLETLRLEWVIEGVFLLFISILIIALYPHFRRKSKVARKAGFYTGAALVVVGIWHASVPALNGLFYHLYTPLTILSAFLIWLPLIFHRGEWN
ncbi:MAG TPA: hypothetical protein VGB16_03650 [candidate division Zixibacteria bacterium]